MTCDKYGKTIDMYKDEHSGNCYECADDLCGECAEWDDESVCKNCREVKK